MSVTRLRELTDDYLAALELGQHKQVSDLSAAICAQLVELYEEGLNDDEEEEEREEGGDELERDDTQYRLVSSLCHALRKQAQLAAAYNDVIQFVHVQDMIRLSQMLGAIPATTTRSHYEQLASVMRKSIYLLRSINPADKDGEGEGGRDGGCGGDGNGGELWLDGGRLEWIRAISTFPTCAIDVGAGALRAPGARQAPTEDKEALLEVCRAQRARPQLSADWFLHFLRRGPLRQAYPADRFVLLVALLIVGAQAGHWALEQLMGELVAQVAHEESNCGGDDEELAQLSQTGAFWLSHHRRHRRPASLAGGPSSSSSASSSPSRSSSASSELGASESPAPTTRLDGRQRLWRRIEAELIRGLACQLCGRRAEGPLAALSPPRCGCCSRSYHCARSHRPLRLIPLADLLRHRRPLRRLVALWPAEWARQAWLAGRCARSSAGLGARAAEERLQLGERFERLTVLQPGHRSSGSQSQSHSESQSTSSDTNDDHDHDDDGLPAEAAARAQVAAFMRSRRRHASGQREDHCDERPSESAQLLRWLLPAAPLAGLNAADLLLMGSAPGNLLQVHLATAGGDIWSCSSVSSSSGLQLGCGRLFAGGCAGRGVDECAHCGRPLLRLRTLAEWTRRPPPPPPPPATSGSRRDGRLS